jgi:hypothetical protein
MGEAKRVLEQAIEFGTLAIAKRGRRFTPRTLSTKRPEASGSRDWLTWRRSTSTRS